MGIPDDDESVALIAERFRILGDPTRLVILRALMAGELNVTELCERIGRLQANVSKQLKIMTNAGLLGRRKDGLLAYYRVMDPTLVALCRLACESVARTAEAEVEAHEQRIKALGRQPKA